MDYDELELEEDELAPTKPYTLEQRAAIDEMNAELARAFDEYCAML